MENKKRGQWSSNAGFIIAAIGSAVGMGNLWGFPYKMGANGGLPFLLIYLGMAILCGVIVMGVEMTIGRHTRKSPMAALAQLGKQYKIVGAFGVLCAFIIMGFYAILIGYSLRYLVGFGGEIFSAGAGFGGASGVDFFVSFTQNTGSVLLYTFITFAFCGLIVAGGIEKGIEKFNGVAIPMLFLILIGIIIYNFTLPGSTGGLEFMFTTKGMQEAGTEFNFFHTLRIAGGQMLFSLSLGMGCMITYGSYLSDNSNISANAWIVPAADTLAAILCGVMIFPAVFAMGGSPNSGPGLLFITMLDTFASMGYAGNIVGFLFYALVIAAGVSSAISLMEVAAANFIDHATAKGKHPNRKAATLLVCLIMFILSVPVCFDQLGLAGEEGVFYPLYQMLGAGSQDLLDVYDFLAEGVMMPLGSVLMCLIVGWKLGMPWMKGEIEKNGQKFHTEKLFNICVKFVTPILMTFVLISLALSFFGI